LERFVPVCQAWPERLENREIVQAALCVILPVIKPATQLQAGAAVYVFQELTHAILIATAAAVLNILPAHIDFHVLKQAVKHRKENVSKSIPNSETVLSMQPSVRTVYSPVYPWKT
jgi:hypothetical protein